MLRLLSVVVDYLDDGDRCHAAGIVVSFLWSAAGTAIRLEDEPMGMDEVHSVLLPPFTGELVPSVRRSRWYHRQHPGAFQDREAQCDRLRHAVTVLFLELAFRVEDLRKFAGLEENIHAERPFRYANGNEIFPACQVHEQIRSLGRGIHHARRFTRTGLTAPTAPARERRLAVLTALEQGDGGQRPEVGDEGRTEGAGDYLAISDLHSAIARLPHGRVRR